MLNGTTLESRNQRPASWSTVTSNLSIRTLAAGRTKSWCPKSTGGFSSNFFVTLCVWGSLLVCTRHHKFAQYLMTSNLYVYIYIYIVQIFLTCVKSLYKSRVNTAHQHITEPKRHGKTWNILKHTRCPVRKWPLSGCWYPGSLRPSRHGWPKLQLGAPRVSHDPVSASEKIELGSTLAILMSRKWTSRI